MSSSPKLTNIFSRDAEADRKEFRNQFPEVGSMLLETLERRISRTSADCDFVGRTRRMTEVRRLNTVFRVEESAEVLALEVEFETDSAHTRAKWLSFKFTRITTS